jgi:hypothetical protein
VKKNGHSIILASLEVRNRGRRRTTMADDSMAVVDGVRTAIEDGDGDFLREAVICWPRA